MMDSEHCRCRLQPLIQHYVSRVLLLHQRLLEHGLVVGVLLFIRVVVDSVDEHRHWRKCLLLLLLLALALLEVKELVIQIGDQWIGRSSRIFLIGFFL